MTVIFSEEIDDKNAIRAILPTQAGDVSIIEEEGCIKGTAFGEAGIKTLKDLCQKGLCEEVI